MRARRPGSGRWPTTSPSTTAATCAGCARRRAATSPRSRRLLKLIKGIGDTGCDIFLREVQAVWDEAYPFVDDLALEAARRNGLPGDAAALAGLVPRDEFPRLVAALTRDQLDNK